jgi:hypothetical protein
LPILCAKAAALGFERVWFAACITLTDNRKSEDNEGEGEEEEDLDLFA